jgi:excisionase family DNA binding protein
MKGDKLLLSVREAAEIIAVGRSTMYELLRAGEVESVRIGRCRRVPHSALVAYVERLRGEATGYEAVYRAP